MLFLPFASLGRLEQRPRRRQGDDSEPLEQLVALDNPTFGKPFLALEANESVSRLGLLKSEAGPNGVLPRQLESSTSLLRSTSEKESLTEHSLEHRQYERCALILRSSFQRLRGDLDRTLRVPSECERLGGPGVEQEDR